MIRSTLCSLRNFSTLAPLLQVALVSFVLGLVFALIEAWTSTRVDYGLEGASPDSLSARVVAVEAGALLVEDLDSGERQRLRLSPELTRFQVPLEQLSGQPLVLSHLRGYLLGCTRDDQPWCVARCDSAEQCQQRLRERESCLGMLGFAWLASLVCLLVHGLSLRPCRRRVGS
ncbi:hypothetical protein NJH78_20205 [Pseudomonas chlororaphis]|uniref:hypothetical protein n=1 Tax=Pseudomonas chlororaphis TaxID=587753 RepID=UPI00209AA92A|nr:hypothetical protein [Pseudomonas chlororaphis]MCO7572311.1 hypothetical protein [Pseudomonas chlororaphis]MCO7589839.1 hypothetical protein [Pseudomonas chlororaphis]MCO7612436.1 hypothetical protein [Pseudomonas chlororaphis]